jgi:hypothetical protein
MRAEEILKVRARAAKTEQERMVAAVNSTDDDIFVTDNCEIIVTGMIPGGDRIYLGQVSETAFYEAKNPRALIERVRFGACRRYS